MEVLENQIAALGTLMQLSRRVRDAATVEEIGFIALNESKQLIQYRQAALWLAGKGIVAVSGLPEADSTSPYVQWLERCCRLWSLARFKGAARAADIDVAAGKAWHEWAPEHAFVAPICSRDDEYLGLLVFFREEIWDEHDASLLEELVSIYAFGFIACIRQGGVFRRILQKVSLMRLQAGILLCLTALMFVPVRLSVLAPAEVVPKDPFVVRSPLDAVIEKFYVKPNQAVSAGDLLFEFDRTSLGARQGVASKAYQVAAEEYRQAAQTALVDEKFRSEIMPRKGRLDEKAMELSYSSKLLKKTEVRAPRSGIAVFAEQSDWVGKNVSVGERVLTIADPARVEILIRLPIADAINFELGSPVRLYLSSNPQQPLDGILRYAAYKPEAVSSGIVAYRIKADFSQSATPPRIGLTGTARIYGKKVRLGYYLFRRPLTVVRQYLGW